MDSGTVLCDHCHVVPGQYQCKACKNAFYCSQECQLEDRNAVHKLECANTCRDIENQQQISVSRSNPFSSSSSSKKKSSGSQQTKFDACVVKDVFAKVSSNKSVPALIVDLRKQGANTFSNRVQIVITVKDYDFSTKILTQKEKQGTDFSTENLTEQQIRQKRKAQIQEQTLIVYGLDGNFCRVRASEIQQLAQKGGAERLPIYIGTFQNYENSQKTANQQYKESLAGVATVSDKDGGPAPPVPKRPSVSAGAQTTDASTTTRGSGGRGRGRRGTLARGTSSSRVSKRLGAYDDDYDYKEEEDEDGDYDDYDNQMATIGTEIAGAGTGAALKASEMIPIVSAETGRIVVGRVENASIFFGRYDSQKSSSIQKKPSIFPKPSTGNVFVFKPAPRDQLLVSPKYVETSKLNNSPIEEGGKLLVVEIVVLHEGDKASRVFRSAIPTQKLDKQSLDGEGVSYIAYQVPSLSSGSKGVLGAAVIRILPIFVETKGSPLQAILLKEVSIYYPDSVMETPLLIGDEMV